MNWLFKLFNVIERRKSIKKQIRACSEQLSEELEYASAYNMDKIKYLSNKLDNLHKELEDTIYE